MLLFLFLSVTNSISPSGPQPPIFISEPKGTISCLEPLWKGNLIKTESTHFYRFASKNKLQEITFSTCDSEGDTKLSVSDEQLTVTFVETDSNNIDGTTTFTQENLKRVNTCGPQSLGDIITATYPEANYLVAVSVAKSTQFDTATKVPYILKLLNCPTKYPTKNPTSNSPTKYPTKQPTTKIPTILPTIVPTLNPITNTPTVLPTNVPTLNIITDTPTIMDMNDTVLDTTKIDDTNVMTTVDNQKNGFSALFKNNDVLKGVIIGGAGGICCILICILIILLIICKKIKFKEKNEENNSDSTQLGNLGSQSSFNDSKIIINMVNDGVYTPNGNITPNQVNTTSTNYSMEYNTSNSFICDAMRTELPKDNENIVNIKNDSNMEGVRGRSETQGNDIDLSESNDIYNTHGNTIGYTNDGIYSKPGDYAVTNR